MLVMKSNVRRKKLEDVGFSSNALEDDDINEDASSFYLTSTQVIPMQIATSISMSSWSVELSNLDSQTTTDDSNSLQSLFPDRFNPNDTVSVNISGFNLQQ
jgi:hypothetical protein